MKLQLQYTYKVDVQTVLGVDVLDFEKLSDVLSLLLQVSDRTHSFHNC